MLRIEFEYRDEMSRWEWRRQTCTCRSVEEAKRFYGLDGDDCEWRIVSVEDDEEKAASETEAPKLSGFSGEEHCVETAKALYELRLLMSRMKAELEEKNRALALLGALIEDVETDAELGGFFCRIEEADAEAAKGKEALRRASTSPISAASSSSARRTSTDGGKLAFCCEFNPFNQEIPWGPARKMTREGEQPPVENPAKE